MEDPPKKFFRLAPGKEVRLRYAYFVNCTEVVKDAAGRGHRAALHLRPGDARRQQPPDGRKVKGTIHWVSAADAVDAEVRLYDHLFAEPDPGRRQLRRRPQPQLAGGAHRLQAGAGAGRRQLGRARAVRAPRLLLRRPRLQAGQAACSTARWPCATPGRR